MLVAEIYSLAWFILVHPQSDPYPERTADAEERTDIFVCLRMRSGE